MNSERGFTLIELLTVVGILGVLSALSLQSMSLYKTSAAFAVANATLRDARTALAAGQSDTSAVLPSIPVTLQAVPGEISDPDGKTLLPSLVVPKNLTFRYAHDAICASPDDIEAMLQANHCFAQKYINYTRFCDGEEVQLELIGGGC